MESFNLVDCWSVINPKPQRYAWHARNKSSRLDYWLISKHFLNEIKKCNITPGLHSDHSIISVEIGKQFYNRGKGFWKLNASLLYDPEYETEIRNIIHASAQELEHYQDKCLIWEIIKLIIRPFSIPYGIKNKKAKK